MGKKENAFKLEIYNSFRQWLFRNKPEQSKSNKDLDVPHTTFSL